MKVRICFITNYAYRLFNHKSRIIYGGIETIFYLMALDIAKDKRFSVSFLLEDDVNFQPSDEKVNNIILYKTSRTKILPVSKDKQIQRFSCWFAYWARKFNQLWQLPHLDFFRLWEKLKQIQADVYIFASPSYESGLLTLLAKLLKKKAVYIVANDELLEVNYKKSKKINDKIYYFGLKHASLVGCFSLWHKKILLNKYGIKAVYLPCWYPKPKNNSTNKKRKYLLWVGRADSRKHPEIFLKLAKCLPAFSFLMIISSSPNEPKLIKTIRKLASKIPNLRLKQDVLLTELDQYYKTALVFIDTSDYQNLNMTQVQAAYYKTPCLSFFYDPNGSYKEFHWGFSASGDFNLMAINIKKLINKPEIWAKLSNNGYAFADKVYNGDNNLLIFKRLIVNLIK